MTDELERYRTRRDLDASPEPPGDPREPSQRPIFVVQQHDASSMHFDVRLEADVVLKSWAAPKGPSTDPRDKQLAVRTEDHPLDYADFEGRIPEDPYGGGDVIVWDIGPYRNLTTDDDAADARRNPTSTEPASVVSGRTIDQIDTEDERDGDGAVNG